MEAGNPCAVLKKCEFVLVSYNPMNTVSVFNDATRHLTDRLTHLYTRAQRYWYDTHPNLRRTMEDRAAKLEREVVETERLSADCVNRHKGVAISKPSTHVLRQLMYPMNQLRDW